MGYLEFAEDQRVYGESVPMSIPSLGQSYRQEQVRHQTSSISLMEIHSLVTRRLFEKHKNAWIEAIRWTSSLSDIYKNPDYQAIINLGLGAVPLIIAEMVLEPRYWFAALTAITGDDPIPPSHYGQLDKMVEDWKWWAEVKQYV